ncbi:signal recognition particle-docking protein FtsY [Nitrososphaera viennensis]|uniref:Signal recognition particle receptor FtsY n=2 Tax=Nitrososphaera viennensis TaxID=1034015 RepID=A0A060HW94_9ARCH|nr:signal recognition particle-docking protein FtsY [Nitrososphaera viennensis]AIC17287.1 signal recognition particle receptor FtsY [Nitrososphaera viennensis EN76]UVS69170.1 signal recognition particle-docking protein FtsY [Nitrososphaera viennensis]
MFDKLKKALSGAAKSIGQKEISEKILDDTLLDLQIELLESDVAQEVVDDLSARLKKDLLGLKLEKGQDASQVIESKLQEIVAGIFARAGRLDIVEKIRAKKEAKQGPFVIVFLGINGTGKTTTVAKVGNLLRKSGISVVVAAGDTHRAGAIEQLTQHAERLSLKVIAQRYGADPSAVGRDAVDYAKKHYIDAVLIDTAGRMQTSKNLMDEMSKIVRVVKPDIKLFVGDSLAGNDTINQAREFFQYANFDGAILTKIDADAKGGAAISIAHLTSKPIAYVGVGQGYDDMIPFDPDKFITSLFGSAAVSVQDLMSAPLPPPPPPTTTIPPRPEQEPEAQQEKEPEPRPAAAAASASPLFPSRVEQEPAKEEPKKDDDRDLPPPPPSPPVQASPPPPPPPPSSPPPAPEPVVREEPRAEKKSRFGGLFGRKKDDNSEDRRRREEEEERRKAEESNKRKEEEEERQRRKEEEQRKKDEDQQRKKREEEERKRKEKEEKKKRKDDKDSKKDDVVYLTDEDIEDLLK